jgi:hypothetical protein
MKDEDKWFDIIYAADLDDHTSRTTACDAILDVTDDLFLAGKFDECNDLLQRVDVSQLNTFTMIAFLAATNPAKDKLSYHRKFFSKIEERLAKEEPVRANALLVGLR